MPPGGGGTSSAVTLTMRPIEPSGDQHATAIAPPGRRTRFISAAVRSWLRSSPSTSTRTGNGSI